MVAGIPICLPFTVCQHRSPPPAQAGSGRPYARQGCRSDCRQKKTRSLLRPDDGGRQVCLEPSERKHNPKLSCLMQPHHLHPMIYLKIYFVSTRLWLKSTKLPPTEQRTKRAVSCDYKLAQFTPTLRSQLIASTRVAFAEDADVRQR